jgi:hypothetical protein
LIVLLFGIAEGRVFRAETKATCNHWWHRDLTDERVVQDILNNPKFYTTSMKDDDRIKASEKTLRGDVIKNKKRSILSRIFFGK